ncbi:probable 4-coumarate--CoA ligase 3 [Chironomus tepperi]|uniref:probable 4-coumarate--CoA ligase 3 n=1 Tax=Chironomus tepperi TaxID=113505 RepID=UPI00391F5678
MNSKFCTYDPVSKIWSGRKRQQIYNADANAGYLFLQKLIQTPKNICQISDDNGVELTCADIYERSLKFANFFTQINLKQGDVVGLIASNSENLVPIIFGCLVIGVAVNPLSIVMTVEDIEHMWSKTKPKVIFSDGKIVGTVKIAVDKMESDAKIFTMIDKVEGFGYVDEILDGDFDVDSYKFPELPNMSTTIATINCSSGTTSSSKGICKSHKQLISDSFLISNKKASESDIIFNCSQSYWTSHLLFLVYGVLYNIPIVITSQPFTPELWIDIVDRYKITLVMVAPMVCYGILNSRKLKKLESTRIVLVGGSVFTTKLIRDFAEIIPNGKVVPVYGSTEADSISMAYKYEDGLIRSSGYPYYNTDIKIVSEDGIALGPNEVGEIYCKKSFPFLGYFDDIQITAESIDSSGFFKTGDAGYFDESGRIYIVDRIKHMIKSINCYKVTPIEIESIINEIDGVILSCVVGVFDEEVFYDKIHAFVIKDQARDDLTEEFIVNFVNAKVIEEKKISGGVHFVDRFPMTPTGKVMNRELKKLAATLSKC